MAREHLIAGTRERVTGRAHHSDEIEGFIGPAKHLNHGDIYSVMRNGEFKQFGHGKSDGLINGRDHKTAIKEEKSFRRGRFQKMSEEYKRPPVGY